MSRSNNTAVRPESRSCSDKAPPLSRSNAVLRPQTRSRKNSSLSRSNAVSHPETRSRSGTLCQQVAALAPSKWPQRPSTATQPTASHEESVSRPNNESRSSSRARSGTVSRQGSAPTSQSSVRPSRHSERPPSSHHANRPDRAPTATRRPTASRHEVPVTRQSSVLGRPRSSTTAQATATSTAYPPSRSTAHDPGTSSSTARPPRTQTQIGPHGNTQPPRTELGPHGNTSRRSSSTRYTNASDRPPMTRMPQIIPWQPFSGESRIIPNNGLIIGPAEAPMEISRNYNVFSDQAIHFIAHHWYIPRSAFHTIQVKHDNDDWASWTGDRRLQGVVRLTDAQLEHFNKEFGLRHTADSFANDWLCSVKGCQAVIIGESVGSGYRWQVKAKEENREVPGESLSIRIDIRRH